MARDEHINPQAVTKRFKEAQDSLVLQASDLSLGAVSDMVKEGAVDIAPRYQRRDRWSSAKQSALIESFLMNVPVPPIYLSEEDYGIYSVIDGKQRITAIHAFMTGKLRLTQLDAFQGVEGARFSDLPRELANALLVRPYIRAVTLLKQSDPELKYEVFSRLNTGGERLNAQEIRNVAFRGALNDLIYVLAGHEFLRQQLKIFGSTSSNYRRMADAELVLRFLTLATTWKSFSGDLSKSMDSFMRRHRHADKAVLRKYERRFRRAIKSCEDLWGEYAFKRPVEGGWRDQALSGVYDAEMIAVDRLSDGEQENLRGRYDEVREATRALFKESEFDESVRVGTNTPSRVRYRVDRLTKELQRLAG